MFDTWSDLQEMDIRNTDTVVEDNPKQVDKTQPEEKPQEQVKEEVKKTEEKPVKKEEIKYPTDNKKEVKPKEEVVEQKDADFLESLNKKYETDYKDYDSLGKTIKESTQTITSLKGQNEQYKKDLELLEKELEEKHEAANPEKIYGSKEGYVKHLIEEKGKQEGYNSAVVNRIASRDLDKIHDLDLIMMDIENSDERLTGKYNRLIALALDEVGIDIDREKEKHEELRKQTLEDDDKDIGAFNVNNLKLTERQLAKLELQAAKIKRKFKEFKKVEVGEYKSYKESKEQRLADFQKQKEETLDEWSDRLDDFKDFKINVKYTDANGEENEYDFSDEEFNKTLIDDIKEYVGNNNIKPTKQNINELRLKLENDFWADKSRRGKALKKMIEDAKSFTEEKKDNLYENPKPISKETAPTEEDNDQAIGAFLDKRKQGIKNLDSIFFNE